MAYDIRTGTGISDGAWTVTPAPLLRPADAGTAGTPAGTDRRLAAGASAISEPGCRCTKAWQLCAPGCGDAGTDR